MLWLHPRKKYVEVTIWKLFRVCYGLMMKLFVFWNNDNFALSISYKSTTKPDKWFMQLLAPTTHTAPSSPVQENFEKKIAITWKFQNNLKIDLKLYIKDCSFWHLKEKYRPWNTGNRRNNFVNPFHWTQVRSWQCTLGVVHILRNHFWGSRETPPPLRNIVIIWAYPPYVIL